MIKSGKLNESVGMTQDDWRNEDPNNWEDGQVEEYIKYFDYAAKALKCKSKELVNITEDDGPTYGKIIDRIRDGDKGKDIRIPGIDGLAGIYTLTNGCTIITTNEWGYGTLYVKKSEVKKAMNESANISESMKISNMTKGMADGYSGIWQLPSGKPGLYADSDDFELVCLGDEEGTQVIMTTEDGDTFYKAFNNEKAAVDTFKKIVSDYNKDPSFRSPSKLARKYGLR